MIFRILYLFAVLTLTAGNLFLMGRAFQGEMEANGVRYSLRRLAVLTAESFPQGNASSEALWRLLGRDGPVLDPWGGAFALETRRIGDHTVFFWRSAGPDGAWGSADDLEQLVTFREGEGSQPPPERPDSALDAK